MPDQNRLRDFNEAKTQAEGRRQQAISEAYRAFNVKHAEAKRLHREAYMAARAAWVAVKSTPEADGYEEARQAFLDANALADHTEARAEWIAPFALLTRRTMRKCRKSPPSTA